MCMCAHADILIYKYAWAMKYLSTASRRMRFSKRKNEVGCENFEASVRSRRCTAGVVSIKSIIARKFWKTCGHRVVSPSNAYADVKVI